MLVNTSQGIIYIHYTVQMLSTNLTCGGNIEIIPLGHISYIYTNMFI